MSTSAATRLTDEQRAAVEATIGDVLRVARLYLRRSGRGRDPHFRGEVESIALAALAEAGLDLDPARAASFASFARRRARWAVVSFLKQMNKDRTLAFCEFTMSVDVVDHTRYRSALDEAAVIRAFEWAAEGITHKEIARRLGVAPNTVFRIISRQTWKHVPIPEALLRAVAIGRGQRRGEDAPGAVLDEAAVLRAFEMAAAGVSHEDIARRIGSSRSAISMLLNRLRWTHVPVPAGLLDAVAARRQGKGTR